MNKLYRAWSIINNYKDEKDVVFHWRCRYRREPILPYYELIKDYNPSQECAQYAEEYVDELLTYDEIIELKHYLKNVYNIELYSKEYNLPIDFKEKLADSGIPIGDCKGYLPFISSLVSRKNFYMLSKEKGYNLSIPIWAYYDLEDCLPTVEIHENHLKSASEYIDIILKEMKIEGVNYDQIKEAVKNIYDKYGLFIENKQFKDKKSRIKDREEHIKKIENEL